MTYTFHLRTGVKFHDGRPFRASNVISTFQRVLDPKTKGGRGWPLYPIDGAKAYAEGQRELDRRVELAERQHRRDSPERAVCDFPEAPRDAVAAIVPDSVPANFGENPIGTGPWKFVEWRHDDYLKFAANTEYFEGRPKADSLMARIVPEPSTAVAEFESGNVDVLYVPEGETRNWEQTDERKAMLESAPALRVFYVAINTTRGPLADKRVRRSQLRSRCKGILDGIVSGRGNLAAGVIPPALPGGDSRERGTRAMSPRQSSCSPTRIPERDRRRALVVADSAVPSNRPDHPGT